MISLLFVSNRSLWAFQHILFFAGRGLADACLRCLSLTLLVSMNGNEHNKYGLAKRFIKESIDLLNGAVLFLQAFWSYKKQSCSSWLIQEDSHNHPSLSRAPRNVFDVVIIALSLFESILDFWAPRQEREFGRKKHQKGKLGVGLKWVVFTCFQQSLWAPFKKDEAGCECIQKPSQNSPLKPLQNRHIFGSGCLKSS